MLPRKSLTPVVSPMGAPSISPGSDRSSKWSSEVEKSPGITEKSPEKIKMSPSESEIFRSDSSSSDFLKHASLDRHILSKSSKLQDSKEIYDKNEVTRTNMNEINGQNGVTGSSKANLLKPEIKTSRKTILYRSKVGKTLSKVFARSKSDSLSEFEKQNNENSKIQLNNGKIKLIHENGSEFEASGIKGGPNDMNQIQNFDPSDGGEPSIVNGPPTILEKSEKFKHERPTKRDKTTKLGSIFSSSKQSSGSGGNSVTTPSSQLTSQIKSTLDSLNSIELLLRNASDSDTHHV